jgi:hypothetical protein
MNTNNQIQIPIPPPPPAPINLVENNKKISKTVMSDVIKELKSKIKPYDA